MTALDHKINAKAGIERNEVRASKCVARRVRRGRMAYVGSVGQETFLRWQEQYDAIPAMVRGKPVRFRYQTPEFISAVMK